MMTLEQIHNCFLQCSGVSTDTRKVQKDAFFVALKGENFDANTFAEKAIELGAKYVLIDNKDYYLDNRTILVEDSLKTLQHLANFHRKYLNLPIIALTGSNGKTTTKELINVVLSKKYITKATVGNLNNHIGVPLTLLSFSKETEIGIVEMGANHQKEIEFLCEIAQPNFGYITNFGKAHLEGFGGIEGVIKGKSEMYSYLLKNNATAFVNLDDAIQVQKLVDIKKYTFSSIDGSSDIFFNQIVANPFVCLSHKEIEIKSNLIGSYNAPNIMAAISIGIYFEVDLAQTKVAIESYFPDNNRSQMLEKGTNKILLDAYNANPSSMKVAIENFVQLSESNKIVILGDMFELGEESNFEHKQIIAQLKEQTDIKCYFVGKYFNSNKVEQANFKFYETFQEFSEYLKSQSLDNSAILIKGSRGMALERTLDFI